MTYSIAEMLIVVSAMSYLMSIYTPDYSHLMKEVRQIEIQQISNQYRLAVESCYYSKGSLDPCESGHYGIPKWHKKSQSIIDEVVVKKGGYITIKPKNEFGFSDRDQFVLKPKLKQGSIEWV